MDVDSILSQFGEKTKAPPVSDSNGGFNADEILSQFNTPEPKAVPKDLKRVIINTDPKPPISGISKEASDELNQTRIDKLGGENPRAKLPTTNIADSIGENYQAGKEMFSSGVEDFGSGHPYKGAGKAALGALGVGTSLVSGLVDGGPAKLIDQLFPKGNQDIPRYPDPIYGTPTGMPKETIASPGDRAGFAVGSAIPLFPGLSALSKALPKNKMLSKLIEDIGPDNLPSVVSQMKANPRLVPADLSPKVLQSTQELFSGGGPVNYLKNTSDARMASSKGAINEAYDTSGGVSVDLAKKIDDLAQSSKKVGNEKIQPAIDGAGPVNITNTMEAIDKVLKPGITSVISGESSLPLTAVKKELAQIKAMLGNDKEMRTSAADLHKFQSGLRTTAESLMGSSTAADKEMGKALLNVRANLVNDIDKASGGKYKPALSSYRDEMHIADAFKEGYDGLFSSSKAMENTPSFVKKWFDGLSEAEQQAAKEGARSSIATEIGVARNPALAGERLSRSDFNKEKLEILFGKEEAATLIKKLEDERTIANTHNKIIEGTQTAMRDNSKSDWKKPEKNKLDNMVPYLAEGIGAYTSGIPAVGTLTYQGLRGASALAHKAKIAIHNEKQARYAQYALPTEGPSRDELIRQLEARIPGPKPSLVTRGAASLSRLVAP